MGDWLREGLKVRRAPHFVPAYFATSATKGR
jgi:hypothetical protein